MEQTVRPSTASGSSSGGYTVTGAGGSAYTALSDQSDATYLYDGSIGAVMPTESANSNRSFRVYPPCGLHRPLGIRISG